MNDKLNFRMYSLVLKQLNPIQKGVQTTHGVIEYSILYEHEYDYVKWSRVNKTLIILDGGTAPEMEDIIGELKRNEIHFSTFREQDLNGLTTTICFLASEQAYDDNYLYLYEKPELIEADTKLYKDYILKKIITNCKLSH